MLVRIQLFNAAPCLQFSSRTFGHHRMIEKVTSWSSASSTEACTAAFHAILTVISARAKHLRLACMLLQLLSRRLRGLGPVQAPSAAGPSSLGLPTCMRCRVHNALLHTSNATRWRTRQERREALHGKDDQSRERRSRPADYEDSGRRHHARASPSRRSNTQTYQSREHERRPREGGLILYHCSNHSY